MASFGGYQWRVKKNQEHTGGSLTASYTRTRICLGAKEIASEMSFVRLMCQTNYHREHGGGVVCFQFLQLVRAARFAADMFCYHVRMCGLAGPVSRRAVLAQRGRVDVASTS